ncbi:hypothetical protein AC578_3433 [Pseudocercospora eumusae]|uniref:Non-ribosomal peptide synthetase n=1 Tax=Pseudocercospora eumusae TaxID=321146 RepID=A0A139HQW5_9PEZI|nr:hypothetical protein AC578_3433 [Pseudocercospora eumusae]
MPDSRPVPDDFPHANPHFSGTTIFEEPPSDMPSQRPTRPTLPQRQYSARVYALPPTSPTPAHLEQGIREPETAHMARHDSDAWPAESLITVRPSERSLAQPQDLRRPSVLSRTTTDFSLASGISCEELQSPPSPILQRVQAHGPGTYRCTVQEYSDSFDSIASRLDGQAKIKLQLERLSTYEEKVATKEHLEYLMKEYPLPEPKHGGRSSIFRYGFFSVYRRLFTLIFLINVAAIAYAAVLAHRDSRLFTYADATNAVAANLFVGTMMRHEHSVNLIFRLMTALPLWLPLAIRRQAAKVYSYGGIHSSCGIGAFMWYLFFAVLVINNFDTGIEGEIQGMAVILACMIFIFLILMVMSYPTIRQHFHNEWEMSHRFAGWIGIALIWAQTLIITFANARDESRDPGVALITTPSFWFLLSITGAVIYPWLRVRHRAFTVEPLSTHAARLHFHHDKVMPTCKGLKLAHSPVVECHAFASIPNPNGEKGYSVIVANNGDWTRELIKNPPEKIWVKGAPVSGVVRLAFLFKRIVVVATGSGIGPCMSFFNAHPEWDVRIIWAARFPATSFGVSTVESVFAADKNALLIDTKKTGKDGLTEICYAVYKESDAEAVVFISNPVGTKEVVFALESRGVPAYGAIWDS